MRTQAIGHHSNETITALGQIAEMDIRISPPSLTNKSSKSKSKKKKIGKQTIMRSTITGIQQQKKNVPRINTMDDDDDDNEDNDDDMF